MVENQEKQERIDWNSEAGCLRNKGEGFWKASPGQHVITFLSDGENKTGEFEGKIIPKVKFLVEVDKQQFFWDVTRGSTKSSLFGQLALVAKGNGGFLLGKTVNVVVKGVKKETSYTVLEALEFMKEEPKPDPAVAKPVEQVVSQP